MEMKNHIDIVREQLYRHEGVRKFVYKCPAGKLTVGVGRNLEDTGLSEAEINYLLENDIIVSEIYAKELVKNYNQLSDNRKAVLINMIFNLGPTGFRKFSNTRRAIEEGRWADAANCMRNSKWYSQVGKRAEELAQLMEKG